MIISYMRAAMTAAVMLLALFAEGQSFDGIPIKGDLNTAVARFKAKGYKVVKPFKDGMALTGMTGNRMMELYIMVTPITKQVSRIVFYLPKRTDWISLKTDYLDLKYLLTKKYGDPTNDYDFFSDNYKEGDGNEFLGVVLGKCRYLTIWNTENNLDVGIDISEYGQVRLSYENQQLTRLMTIEKEKIDERAF